MQRGCTATQGRPWEGEALEVPVLLSENFENTGFGVFSKTRTIFFGRRLEVSKLRLDAVPTKVACDFRSHKIRHVET